MNGPLNHKHKEESDHITRSTPNNIVIPEDVLSLNSNNETKEGEKYRRYDVIESQTQKKDICRLLEQAVLEKVRKNDEEIPEE